MRKVILYSAFTLDGFIARKNGEIDFLDNHPNPQGLDYGYNDFLAEIDTTLMGYKTYEKVLSFGGEFPYKDKQNLVFTQKNRETAPFVNFFQDPVSSVMDIKSREGKSIWLVGGGQINSLLLEAGLIDELRLSLIPIVLGEGIPLFPSPIQSAQFEWINTESFENGVVNLYYRKK